MSQNLNKCKCDPEKLNYYGCRCNKTLMTRNEAREVFKSLGLNYNEISPIDIRQLSTMIETELIIYLRNGGLHAGQMNMIVAPIKKKDLIFENGKLKSCRIEVNGAYFKRREAITFSQTGFIGFGGELDDYNVQPILKAFCKWCADMKELQQ